MDVRTLRERIRNCRTEVHRVADMAADIERQDEFRSTSYGPWQGEGRRFGRTQGGGLVDAPAQGIRRAAERCASQLSEIERELDGDFEASERGTYGYGYSGLGRGVTGFREPRDRERAYASRSYGLPEREGWQSSRYAAQYR